MDKDQSQIYTFSPPYICPSRITKVGSLLFSATITKQTIWIGISYRNFTCKKYCEFEPESDLQIKDIESAHLQYMILITILGGRPFNL